MTDKTPPAQWVVVTDFDGTLTKKDIGNELCNEVLGAKWHKLHAEYREGVFDLKEYQKKVWNHFPLNEPAFVQTSLKYAELRPGVEEFLCRAVDSNIPVYVASCGLRPYIEAALKHKLSPKALSAIKDIRCNEVRFSSTAISEFIPPITKAECPFPLDKGAWAREISASLGTPVKLLGIGNGTSDQSFWGVVDQLAAIESLEKWCVQNRLPYTPFVDFFDLAKQVRFFDAR